MDAATEILNQYKAAMQRTLAGDDDARAIRRAAVWLVAASHVALLAATEFCPAEDCERLMAQIIPGLWDVVEDVRTVMD
jgi:hypothetical protein